MLNTFVDIFTAPRVAYQRLRETAPVLLPLCLLAGAVFGFNYAYFNLVDPEFLVEQIIAQSGEDLPKDQEAAIREQFSEPGPPARGLTRSPVRGIAC